MKRTKRIICALLALICCFGAVVCMTSCGGEDNGNENLFYVNYRNIRIELDQSADNVLTSLGTAKYTDNLGDCGGIGVQMKYTFSDISVNTLKEKDGEKIHKISFISDLVQTPKGIYIGCARQAVLDAYGTPTSDDSEKLVYKSADLKLEFKINGDKVAAIDYVRVR